MAEVVGSSPIVCSILKSKLPVRGNFFYGSNPIATQHTIQACLQVRYHCLLYLKIRIHQTIDGFFVVLYIINSMFIPPGENIIEKRKCSISGEEFVITEKDRDFYDMLSPVF